MSKVTILGQHISIIRPSLPHQCKVYKNELPRPTYDETPKTIRENTGSVVSVVVKLKDGAIRGIGEGIHSDVLKIFGLKPNDVGEVGWLLENGNYVWR